MMSLSDKELFCLLSETLDEVLLAAAVGTLSGELFDKAAALVDEAKLRGGSIMKKTTEQVLKEQEQERKQVVVKKLSEVVSPK